MGNNQPKVNKASLKFDEKEDLQISELYKKYQVNDKFDKNKFNQDIFINLQTNIISFLQDYYKNKNINLQLDPNNLSDDAIVYLAYVLIKANQNEEDEFNLYFRRPTFFILNDIIEGKVGNFQKEDSFTIDKLTTMFDFIINIYINKHEKGFVPVYDKNTLKTYLTNNLSSGVVDKTTLLNFIDNKLYNLEPFLKSYFKQQLLNNYSILTFIPLQTDTSTIMSTDQFLFFCLSNPHIYSKRYAFKLWDCSKNGYNVPNLIYSFLGFDGPVVVFVQHFDLEDGKTYILGAYLHSNFKECFENCCGDDLSFIFTLTPKLHYYKFIGEYEKICYISSKNQKFLKKDPGIGLGWYNGNYRLWIDSNECFKKSYFTKYDDVFEDGSPFEDPMKMLNVCIYMLI